MLARRKEARPAVVISRLWHAIARVIRAGAPLFLEMWVVLMRGCHRSSPRALTKVICDSRSQISQHCGHDPGSLMWHVHLSTLNCYFRVLSGVLTGLSTSAQSMWIASFRWPIALIPQGDVRQPCGPSTRHSRPSQIEPLNCIYLVWRSFRVLVTKINFIISHAKPLEGIYPRLV